MFSVTHFSRSLKHSGPASVNNTTVEMRGRFQQSFMDTKRNYHKRLHPTRLSRPKHSEQQCYLCLWSPPLIKESQTLSTNAALSKCRDASQNKQPHNRCLCNIIPHPHSPPSLFILAATLMMRREVKTNITKWSLDRCKEL